MPEFIFRTIDVEPQLKQKIQPVIMYQRPLTGDAASNIYNRQPLRYGEFWVPDAITDKIEWNITSKGEMVRIPMFAYRTAIDNPAQLVSCGFELGVRCFSSFIAMGKNLPESVMIFSGEKCHRVEGGLRYYLGVAIQV